MQNTLKNTEDAASMPQQHSRLVSSMFRDYRNNFGLFWRVMFPLIIVNLLLYAGLFLFFKLVSPTGQWTISTESSLATRTLSSQSSQPVGVAWGMNLGPSSAHIGLLWLAMCPLAYIIVQRCKGIDLTFKAVWQRTFRKTVPILGIGFLIVILVPSVPVILGFLVFEMFLEKLLPSYASTFFFVSALIVFAWFLFTIYLVVKWSLYNQGIIAENLSAIASLRRSSELVRGAWWRFLGVYLLLIWASTVLTSLMLGLTLVILSFAVPELIPMREVLHPAKLVTFLVGGYGRITLESAPNFWTVGVIVSIHTLIHAILAPVWASLTTQLYMERAGEHAQQIPA